MLAPYRTESAIEKYVPKKYGLIKKTDHNPWRFFVELFQMLVGCLIDLKGLIIKHRCKYPRIHSRIWNFVKGCPFAPDSLYRCHCGAVWISGYSGRWSRAEYSGLRLWKEAGGEE